MALTPSRYNVARPLPDGRVAVFNTWTEALLVVPSEIADAIGTRPCAQLPAAWTARLLRQGVVVPEGVNEAARARARLQSNLDGRVLQVIAVPTWACNLCCAYCYEATALDAASRPQADWAERIGRFVANALSARPQQALAFALFGGEPLLQSKACVDVLERVHGAAAAANVPLQCTLTTNGTLATRQLARLLHLVDTVQVTLDGGRATHDRLRIGPNRRPTFDRIVAFAAAVRASGARCVIRYHLHPAGREDTTEAAEMLLNALGADERIAVYFAEVGCGSYQQAFDGCATAAHVDTARLAVARSAFLDAGWPAASVRLWEKGSAHVLPCAIRCGYLNDRTFLVDPSLDVYFCPVAVRNPLMRAGSIDTNGRMRREASFERLLTVDRFPPACLECEYLPLCEGGCPARAAVRNGSVSSIVCERERIAAIIAHNMQQLGATA